MPVKRELTRPSASAAVAAAVIARLFSGLMAETPDVHNGAWLSAVIGLAVALPVLFVMQRWKMPLFRWALALFLIYDAYDVLENAAFSESFIAFDHMPVIVLMLPLVLAAARCVGLGGDALGAAARLWLIAFVPLIVIVLLYQWPYYRPGWLAPALGFGLGGILRAGVRCAGWMIALGGAGLMLCPDMTFGHMAGRLAMAAAVAALLIVLRLMMAPALDAAGMDRRVQLDALLTNGRAPLYTQLPMIVMWTVGMLHALCFEAWAALALLPRKGRGLLVLLVAAALLLTGCRSAGEVEDQAYALVLGVDAKAGGGIELTIRIPRIGHTGGGEEETSEDAYLVLAAAGDGYAEALERLQWTAARELNLSHLKLIVASEALATSDAFPDLIDRLAETRHLYATAGFVVCEGRARDFIEGQETILGTHLSGEIAAMFRHYAAHGYIPRATFADLYYATHSIYSDPAGIWGFMDAGESKPAAAMLDADQDALNADTLTASTRQYLGAALFRDGRMVGRLGAGETLLLDLMTGSVDSFTYAADGATCILSTLRGPRLRVDKDIVRVEADIFLNAEDASDRAALDNAEIAMRRDMEALVRRCQAMGVEPFGFAERAAASFPTYAAWEAFDWHSKFADARVEVAVRIEGSGG